MHSLVDILMADHKKFLEELRALDHLADQRQAADPHLIKAAVEKLAIGLRRHAALEDEQFMPAFRQRPDLPAEPFSETFFMHLEAEHRGIEDYLQRLSALVNQSPLPFHWPQTYALLARSLKSHFRKEEEQIFPLALKS